MALGRTVDRYGNPIDGEEPQNQPQVNNSNGRLSQEDATKFVTDLSQKYGNSVEQSDISNLMGKNPEDIEAHKSALIVQAQQRGASNGAGVQASGGYGPTPGGSASGGFHGGQSTFEKVAYDPFKYNFSSVSAPNFSQFQRPNYSAVENPSLALAQSLVTNPHTLTPEAIGAMKEKQKEEALAMQTQLMPNVQRLQANGMLGAGNALQRQYAGDMLGTLTKGYRDTDLAAIAQNRTDELSALQGADQVLANHLARQTTGYNTELGGQQAQQQAALQNAMLDDSRQSTQAGENQFAAQFQFANNQASENSYSNSLAQDLAQRQFMELIRQFNAQQQNQLMLAGFNANQVRP